jgi:hypothetical protein
MLRVANLETFPIIQYLHYYLANAGGCGNWKLPPKRLGHKDSVHIKTGIEYRGELEDAGAIADFCAQRVLEEVETYFTKIDTQLGGFGGRGNLRT